MTVNDLISQFQMMYREHWSYEWGKASWGCVDCSGAFVYVLRQYGLSIAHGSNTIARKYIIGDLLQISEARPGMMAFKCRSWREQDRDNQWYGSAPGDIYHVGLVDEDPAYVLNAKSEKSGFCRDPLEKWDYVAYLKKVEYTEVGPMQKATVWSMNGGPVKMRQKPSDKCSIYEELPFGTEVEVIQKGETWTTINAAGRKGWYMKTAFLVFTEVVPEDPEDDQSAAPFDPDDHGQGEMITITLTRDQAAKVLDTLDLITAKIAALIGRG